MFVGVVVLMWTLAVMTGIVFECEMPRPWEIWTGKCIPMVCCYFATSSRYGTDMSPGTFLDHSDGGRYRHRRNFDRSFCTYGVDIAARLPPEDTGDIDILFAHLVSAAQLPVN
jgi:hypothetical protein